MLIFMLRTTIPIVCSARNKPTLCRPGKPLPAELCYPLERHQSCISSLGEQVDSSGNQERNGPSWEAAAKETVSL